MRRRAVLGTPISSIDHLKTLKGHSFCVSYFHRKSVGAQINTIVEIVGDDEILILDNGAFSYYTQNAGEQMDDAYLLGYAKWALEILSRCPQAVWVMPDVIGENWEVNDALEDRFEMLCGQAGIELSEDRCMRLWHLDEPIEKLTGMVTQGVNFIGLGSAGQYWNPKSPEWAGRMKEAFAAVEQACEDFDCVRPWVHLMRAQSQSVHFPVESSDSTNVAVNCHRHKTRLGAEYVREFAQEICDKTSAHTFGLDRKNVCLPRQAAKLASSKSAWLSQQKLYWQACQWFKQTHPESSEDLVDWVSKQAKNLLESGADKSEIESFFAQFGLLDEVNEFAYKLGLWKTPIPWVVLQEQIALAKKALKSSRKPTHPSVIRNQECLALES